MATTLKIGIKSNPLLISQKLDFINVVDAAPSIPITTWHLSDNPELSNGELKGHTSVLSQ
jgi:hypothetical protein